ELALLLCDLRARAPLGVDRERRYRGDGRCRVELGGRGCGRVRRLRVRTDAARSGDLVEADDPEDHYEPKGELDGRHFNCAPSSDRSSASGLRQRVELVRDRIEAVLDRLGAAVRM